MSLTSGPFEQAAAGSGRTPHAARSRRWPSPAGWWAWVAAGVVLVVGSIVLASATSGTTFWADEWQWILYRRGGGLSTLLDPHNSHLSLVPILIYKALFATAGLHHYWPYRAVLIAAELACATLVFLYARPRAGGLLAVLASALILFFGPGWQDILWPFQMAWVIAVAGGVAALLALDRHDRAGDVAACMLLTISVCSSGPGLAVLAGGLVDVLGRRRRRDLWIPGIPIVLYALWSLKYQNAPIYGESFLMLPRFVFDAAAGVLSSLAGLANIQVTSDTGDYLSWGAPLLLLGVLAMAWRLVRLGRIPWRVVTLSVMAVGFWVLTGIGRAYLDVNGLILTSTGDESRYLYIGAVLVVLLAVELLRGWRPGRWGSVAIVVLGAAAIVSNLSPLHDGGNYLRNFAALTEGELAAINLERGIVAPTYASQGFVFGALQAGPWFAAEHALGSQAAVPEPVTGYSDTVRAAADRQIIAIQTLAVRPVATGSTPPPLTGGATAPTVGTATGGSATTRGACVRFTAAGALAPGATSAVTVTIPPGGLLIEPAGTGTSVAVRRFGPGFDPVGTVSAGGVAALTPRPDGSEQPWVAQVTGSGQVGLCTG